MSNIKARYLIKIIDAVKDGKIKSANNLCNYIVNGSELSEKPILKGYMFFLLNIKKEKS